MTIRDLGYRPYDGPRLPPSNAVWVLFRYGLGRAWASWLVKLAAFTAWLPVIGFVIGSWAANSAMEAVPPEARDQLPPIVHLFADESRALSSLFGLETWFFVSLVTVGAGAGAIAHDRTHRAFQFYFAKPVTPETYLAGRVSAIATWVFAIAFVPAFLYCVALAAFGPREEALDTVALLLPALVFSLLLAIVMSIASVAVSSLSASRALTISTWLTVFVVPHVIAGVVDVVSRASGREEGFPWLYLGSFTAMLGTVRDALFKIDDPSALEWFHAAGALAVMVVGLGALALHRLRAQEVIT
ncbi:ABC transporter permease subunit [Sandaracinus amylolyticus]|uniref:ABC transporter permease subunit n=1 Tax=Sandaracinus amylolyticus TaxID=927083 RepID=UPI00069DA377|nr:ABC transporter permease subunit [Sandaracinus amylolyticus]